MAQVLTVDMCVVGGGSAGLAAAAGASQMGAATVLIEKGKMGGDCLNYGCVPSKSLLAAAHMADAFRRAGPFGIEANEPKVDFSDVHDHVHGVIAAIEPHDSVERFEGLGVKVLQCAAEFTGPRELVAGDVTIRARRFVLATGSSPIVPPIPGIADTTHLTNETIFDLRDRPEHLIVIGGGPVGIELAQAHRALGSRVTVVEMFQTLGAEDPELADVVRNRLRAGGVEIRDGAAVRAVEPTAAGIAVSIDASGQTDRIEASHLLVATGRRPNVDGLGLEAAGVEHSPKGIVVDRRLRTSNRKIFAIGDVAGGPQFTHVAGYHAGIVLRNALFRLPARVDTRAVPRVTYTDPELAYVGLTEAQARETGREIRILRFPFSENDRANAERLTDGLVKVVTSKRGAILGAGIVGARAGELIQPWVLAIAQKLKIGALAGMIAPYPTLAEVNKSVAGTFYTPMLFGERTRRIVRLLAKFG